jgi:hypothetical protein
VRCRRNAVTGRIRVCFGSRGSERFVRKQPCAERMSVSSSDCSGKRTCRSQPVENRWGNGSRAGSGLHAQKPAVREVPRSRARFGHASTNTTILTSTRSHKLKLEVEVALKSAPTQSRVTTSRACSIDVTQKLLQVFATHVPKKGNAYFCGIRMVARLRAPS